MHARFMSFKMEPGSRSEVKDLVNKFDPLLKTQKGFQSATYFGDDSKGEYGSFVVWDSEENAEAAREAILPRFEKVLSGKLKGEPVHPLFEVFEPGK